MISNYLLTSVALGFFPGISITPSLIFKISNRWITNSSQISMMHASINLFTQTHNFGHIHENSFSQHTIQLAGIKRKYLRLGSRYLWFRFILQHIPASGVILSWHVWWMCRLSVLPVVYFDKKKLQRYGHCTHPLPSFSYGCTQTHAHRECREKRKKETRNKQTKKITHRYEGCKSQSTKEKCRYLSTSARSKKESIF